MTKPKPKSEYHIVLKSKLKASQIKSPIWTAVDTKLYWATPAGLKNTIKI